MISVARNFVLFRTYLFVFRQRDEDTDKWFVGGDCAGWFYVRLLLTDRIQRECEPVMEDWGGWTFAVSVKGVRVWTNVWAFHAIENCWLFGVEPKNRLIRRHSSNTMTGAQAVVCDALEKIIATEVRILKHGWFAENPFDLNVKGF
jgi:hypothetical protein